MGFHKEEMERIEKATSGFFKKQARQQIASSITSFRIEVESAKRMGRDDMRERLEELFKKAGVERQRALMMGATSYADPFWAAAAVQESWIHEFLNGTPESIRETERVIARLENR